MIAAILARVQSRVSWSGTRILALLAVALALGAPVRTMYHLTDVVGSPTLFLVIVALAALAAAGLARVLRPSIAVVLGVVLLAGGLTWYLTTLSNDPSVEALLTDVIALLTGRSLLQIENVRLWALSIAPAPVFLTLYFALRRWYVTATVAAGATLSFFILTTDAGLITALIGVVGSVATIGFGNLDTLDPVSEPSERRRLLGADSNPKPAGDDDGIDSGRRAVLEQLAAIILLPAVLSRVPAVTGAELPFAEEAGEATIETSLIDAKEKLTILGDISLAPTIRFTVESPEPRYWRVATYDRYTGTGWVRTGNPGPYLGGRLDGPPGETRTVEQTFTAETTVSTIPAAWRPVAYRGDIDVDVTTHGGLQPTGPLTTGDSYEIESEVPVATPQQLREAGTDYPDEIESQYTQLPDSTPDRVNERTSILTANAQNPYEVALVVEQWLQNNRAYSLEVDRPERNVADKFLFEMDRGYCVYYATTMVAMLRTQGIPARFTVGYTTGEQVDDDRWVVRGLNSHAWVEMYIPDHGWIQFDPTPSSPREDAEQSRIEQARAEDETAVDTNETQNETAATETEIPTPTPESDQNETNASDNSTLETPAETGGETPTPFERLGQTGDSGSGGITLPEAPSREEATLGIVALLGIAAGVRRSGVADRVSRALWLRYQRREDPETDVERAFQRAMYVLGRRHRTRESGETVRAYLRAVEADDRFHRLATLRERARYAGEVDDAIADEAVEIADRIVSER